MPPRALLEAITDAAGYAPGSPHHRIGWVRSFTIVSGEEQMRQVREMAAEYMRRTHRLVTGWMVRMADGCTVRRFGTSGSGRAPDLAMRLRELAAGRELITGVVNTTVLSVVDAALVPGLNEYYRLYQGQRPAEAERLREEAMAMLAHAVLKHPGS